MEQAFLQRTYEARDRYVASPGHVSSDVLAPALNPTHGWTDLAQFAAGVAHHPPEGKYAHRERRTI